MQYIWDLTDYSPESDQEWWKGQVNFNTHRLQFEVSHGSNDSQAGFAALDSIKFDYSNPACEPSPPDAGVVPTDPPPTETTAGVTSTTMTITETSSPTGLCPDGWIESMEGCFLFQYQGGSVCLGFSHNVDMKCKC